MDVYVARQPIFDKHMTVFGYELLYRKGTTNNFYEGQDDDISTADVIYNAFLVMQLKELTDGTRAFINFSGALIEKGIPYLLPKETIVIELLETVVSTDAIIEECKKLRGQGYTIALDDFTFKESQLALLEIADIVKVEYQLVPHDIQHKLIAKFGHKIKFIAEKIETREDFKQAVQLGFDYFQGYFFCKPVILTGKEVKNLSPNLIQIIGELNKPEPRFEIVSGLIERDLGLAYKLLKLANSIHYATSQVFKSIGDAVVRLGIEELRRWVYLLMMRSIGSVENKELIKTSIIRAKLMELLALEMGFGPKSYEFFLTGMFSSIDILLNREMEDILEELLLSTDVYEALMGYHSDMRLVLNNILIFERANWEKWEVVQLKNGDQCISREKFMDLYFEAIVWTMEMNVT